ncbi:hypothetical protein D3C87_1366900 [compost metagenome]
MARLVHGGLGIEREPRINLRGHAARHDGQDLAAEGDQELVHHGVQACAAMMVAHSLLEQGPIFGFLHRLENQGRIGGRVLRRVLLHQLEVAGIGHYRGELSQLL